MKGNVRYCLSIMAMLITFIGTAFALVGDVGDLELYIPPEERESGTTTGYSNVQSIWDESGSVRIYTPYQEASDHQSGQGGLDYQEIYGHSFGLSPAQSLLPSASSVPPGIGGPVEDQLTADALGLSMPRPESYAPDTSLNFVPSALPENIVVSAYSQGDSAMTGFETGSSYGRITGTDRTGAVSTGTGSTGTAGWYYPGLVSSPNRLYVQSYSGLSTVAGCSYKGYLPLWADIRSKGYFFIYEWYPGESSALVRSLGWTDAGYKKGWFTGDVPGWHIISYYCGSWSNYIYIYVYPPVHTTAPASTTSYTPDGRVAMQASLQTPSALPLTGQSILPAGAPMPPNIASEQIVLPDYNLYPPASSRAGVAGYYDGPAIKSAAPVAVAIYPAQRSGVGPSARTTTSCTTSTLISEGVYESCPSERGQKEVAGAGREGHGTPAPEGYTPSKSKGVYPEPSTCRCNEYYVLSCQGEIDTVAGVYSDEWLPLWSKISRSGEYWSYEWKVCRSSGGKGCNPEVANFGYKKAGWYQTWFKGSEPGWHILSYHCNDWSNYIYIYVWPAD